MAATGILYGCVVPHPPVLLPEVGRDMAREVEPTVEAVQEIARKIAEYEPETLVLISPHGPLLRDSMAIGMAPEAKGDFAMFQAPEVSLKVPCDVELASAIRQVCGRVALPVTPVDRETHPEDEGRLYWLDHGAAVPLHFLLPLLGDVRVVLLGYSWQPRATHLAFGQRIAEACRESGRRAVYVASGDLSHRLTRTAPAGYDPQGQVFDEEVVAGLAAGDWERIAALSSELVERAGVCGYNSILTLAGAMGEGVQTSVLSYQGPFGVGYVVAGVQPAPRPMAGAAPAADPVDASVRQTFRFEGADLGEQLLGLARASLEAFVRTGLRMGLPAVLPAEFEPPRSCFVTLWRGGQLRGCVGTVEPARETLAVEVLENAIGAGARDYRFLPVRPDELSQLAYSVDVLSPLETAAGLTDMDPAHYGMVVRQGSRVGVLLPGIPDIADAQQQFEVCCQKAGINTPEAIELLRFTVDRYAESGAGH
ncbi:MAG TPA: AmmeMemoRadiSam system protein A [Chloroflexota bacterium]